MSADNNKKSKKSSQNGKTNAASNASNSTSNTATNVDDNTCVVCFKTVEIFSIGECDHPVCYECSTRMRVLCEQNECPICRQVLSKVIFTYDKLPYRELEAKNRSEYYSKKYKICFYTSEIQQKFFELLDHPCPKCDCPPYRTFQGLRNHVRKEHDHFYCDLCVENLKIFTFERRSYTQAELGIHRTKGDPDNRSHRGHPLCEYCNKRYLDRDELFRHLRREHYYCHFCDADGCNEFYRDYSALAEHFRQDHFLCEEGKCATEEFTGAFRSEIDYKAHVANVHGKGMNKQQAKQTRTLQLEITLGPRGRSGQTEQGVANMRSRGSNNHEQEPEIPEPSYPQQNQTPTRQNINPCSEQEFPSLAGGATGPSLSLTRPPPPTIINHNRISGLARTKENFPALGGSTTSSNNSGGDGGGFSAARSAQQQQQQPISAMLKKKPTPATGAVPRTPTPKNGPSTSSGMVIHVSNRPTNPTPAPTKKPSVMDFPALPAATKSKKGKSSVLTEDMGTSSLHLPVSTVSAKHRTLVDDYVSVANPANFQKIQLVQKEELEAKARREAEARSAPKLTKQDFPSLGGPSKANSSAPATTWVKQPVVSEKRQKELENRKNKVAPAPVLPTKTNNYASTVPTPKPAAAVLTNGNVQNNAANIAANNKKDKKEKTKEKKAKETNNNNENKATNNNVNNNSNNNNQKQTSSSSSSSPPPKSPQAKKSPPSQEHHSNVTVNSVAKSPNNLTFTSSLGESYSILPAHTFTPPTDAMLRNQRLILYFRDILESMEALEEFRNISQLYRDGVVKADSYYEHCQAALKDKFDYVFPELVVLLPDISKQQSLYLVHQQRLNTMPAAKRKNLPTMEVCSTCKQVLLPVDMADHKKMHEIVQNFPELSGNRKSLTKA
ncbi:E3 ubiquitin-protein ligase ZNF598 [Musca autumnalis]|uniref:E3 ubiquitin-protein ligase ZNF598 n=1 Tax=Musca autumnalis TaxID=221902 RepID=UPI003CF26894